MAMPVISVKKEEISYNERASYSVEGDFNGTFRLAHSIWDCKYHIVWIPKYRRKELYRAKRRIVVDTIKQWARIKGVEIIEGHAMPDHIHLCVSIPLKYSVAHTIGLLKGKSASEVMSFGTKSTRMVRGRTFWARGYCVSTVGWDEQGIRKYIREQEKSQQGQEQ